ncbi:hypothetical protein E4U57_000742 [Claviceps arundinis]|uniref:Uncharacterized protein n=1 Tax=Claviceps arundinis TaxID=1623583 RepID=A0ABQ7PCA8_9HYPO|nr:hypothetical protein E4U57_000742 [Claviceps arundinis]
MESHTATQQQIVTVTDRARQFVESIIDCRSSSAVQDGGQTTLLASRVDAIEDTVQDLERQMGSVNTKMDTFETTMAAIHDQLRAMKESNDKLTSQVTRLELNIDSRFTEMDDKFTNLESSMESSMDSRFKKMDAKFTKMNTQMKKMDQSMNTQLQGMNSRIAKLSSDMHSGFAEMTEKNQKTSIKMEALNKNTMARFDNRLPGAPPDALEPLFNVNTGKQIQSVNSRADFADMSYVAMAECLQELGLAVPKHEDERLRQVKKAYGAVDVTVGVH